MKNTDQKNIRSNTAFFFFFFKKNLSLQPTNPTYDSAQNFIPTTDLPEIWMSSKGNRARIWKTRVQKGHIFTESKISHTQCVCVYGSHADRPCSLLWKVSNEAITLVFFLFFFSCQQIPWKKTKTTNKPSLTLLYPVCGTQSNSIKSINL